MEEEICPICGLPKSLCVCGNIEKETKKIKIYLDRRRNKVVTIIQGLEDVSNIKEIVRDMKHKFSCGGTFKNGEIILQGDHVKKVKEYLINLGYREDQIDVI